METPHQQFLMCRLISMFLFSLDNRLSLLDSHASPWQTQKLCPHLYNLIPGICQKAYPKQISGVSQTCKRSFKELKFRIFSLHSKLAISFAKSLSKFPYLILNWTETCIISLPHLDSYCLTLLPVPLEHTLVCVTTSQTAFWDNYISRMIN